MAATGGDLIEATYNHPTVGNGVFYFMSNEEGTFKPGGFSSSDDEGMVDGSGKMIDVINQKRWSVEGTYSWDMNTNNELQKFQDLSASPDEADWTFSHVSGTVWVGRGKPVGDIGGNTGKATTAIKIAGGGRLSIL